MIKKKKDAEKKDEPGMNGVRTGRIGRGNGI